MHLKLTGGGLALLMPVLMMAGIGSLRGDEGVPQAATSSPHPASSPPAESPAGQNPGIDTLDSKDYAAGIRKLLVAEQFDDLEHIAGTARSQKSRFPGGQWKLFMFYEGVCACQNITEEQWLADLGRLKRWVAAKPESITARTALADAYFNYAWAARGVDYADLVDENAWSLFRQRLQLARETLQQAATLKEKCPHWYFEKQKIARGEGRGRPELDSILEEAYSFEPLYQYFYEEYAYELQPRWFGAEGDSERFAEQIANRIGGEQGAAMYYFLASSLYCTGCSESEGAFSQISWPRIQEGYAAVERLYGTSSYVLNAYAHLAVRAEDRTVALPLFMRVGDNWDQDVWRSRHYFDSSRNWAIAPTPELMAIWQSAASPPTRESVDYYRRFSEDFDKNNAAAIQTCTGMTPDDKAYFQLLLELDETGNAKRTLAWPPTRLSACIVPKLAMPTAGPPPHPSYWIILPVMGPQVMRSAGSPLPDCGD